MIHELYFNNTSASVLMGIMYIGAHVGLIVYGIWVLYGIRPGMLAGILINDK